MTPRAAPARLALLALASLAAAAGARQAALEAQAATAAQDAPAALGAAAAREALAAQPLEAAALRDLALSRGGRAPDLRLLTLADRVSRRDFQTQLLLLEANAQSGDTAATLRHYDALLATAPAAREDLFRVLTRALPIPEIQAGVLAYKDRAWFADLVAAAGRQSGGARLALDLARRGGLLAPGEARDRLAPGLIEALLADGEAGAAWDLAAAVGRGDWQRAGFGLAARDERLGPFAWRLTSTTSASAEWRGGETLALSVEPGRLALVASRATRLPAGTYRLSLSFEVPSPPGARVEWRLACLGDGASSLAVSSLPPPEEPTLHQEVVTIPGGCPFQSWGLWAEGADAQTASQGLISDFAVEGL